MVRYNYLKYLTNLAQRYTSPRPNMYHQNPSPHNPGYKPQVLLSPVHNDVPPYSGIWKTSDMGHIPVHIHPPDILVLLGTKE